MKSSPTKASELIRIYADAIIILLTLPFYVSLYFHDTYIDEGFAVTRNQDVTSNAPHTWYDVLIHDFWGQDLWPKDGIHWTHKSYRPLVTYSFKLSYYLFEEQWTKQITSLRFFNCVTHTLVCLAMRRVWFFKDNVFAVFLFAVHPIHVENIVYMVGRADSLATLFWLLGCDSTNVVRVLVCTILAGLCKETGFTLPILVAFLCFLRKKWNLAFIFLGEFLLVFAVRAWYVEGTSADFGYVDTPVRYMEHMVTRFWSYLLHHQVYGQLLIAPWNMSWDYSFDSLPIVHQQHKDLRVVAIFGAYILMILMFYITFPRRQLEYLARREAIADYKDSSDSVKTPTEKTEKESSTDTDDKKDWEAVGGSSATPTAGGKQACTAIVAENSPLVRSLKLRKNDDILTDLFAAAQVVIPFVPASNLFFLVGTTVGERLMYISSVGSCLLLDRLVFSRNAGIENIVPPEKDKPSQSTGSSSSSSSSSIEKNDGSTTMQSSPLSLPGIEFFLGGFCLLIRRLMKLLFISYYMYVGYVRCSHWRSKEVLFKVDAHASRWQPRSAKVLHQYAVLLQASGKLDEAKDFYVRAINVFDDNAMSDYCVARIWLEKNNCEEALKIFIKINNGHGIGFGDHNQFLLNNDFGYALACMTAYKEAIPILEEALTLLSPNFEYVYNSLALSVYETDRSQAQRVVEILNTGLQYHPGCFTLWYNIAIVLFQNGAADEGQKAIIEAEKLITTLWEYQQFQEGVKLINEGRMGEIKMLFLQVPTAKG